MTPGARNQIVGKVTAIKQGDVMSLVKVEVEAPHLMSSVITTESVEEMRLAEGDQVELIIKAVHVLPVKLD